MLRLLSTLLALVITTSAGAGTRAADQSGGRFVFGTDVDPIVLDPALSSEPSSARVENQIFESLVDLAPGGTRVVPKLATSWQTSNERRTWTFLLRRGVKFHDGTPLNARAVCFNFERWSHFEGSLQRAAYYWAFIFGSKPSDSLYRGCEAVGELTVRLHLARATTSFLAALAFPSFGISSPIALRKYDADAGEADANGAFDPAGTYGTAHPTGTGPFVFKSWRRGADVVLVRNRRYWGKQAKLDRLVFRPIVDGLERVRALQRGTIHGLDVDLAYVGATSTIKRDPKLKLLPRPSSNVGFVAMNQQIAPLDKPLVRQAIAYGLDRRTVVRSFYSGRGQVADQLLPPIFVGHARKVRRYPFDPARSRWMGARPDTVRAEIAGTATEGRDEAAGEARLLVPDRRVASVHARSKTQLRDLRGEPGAVWLQGCPAQCSLDSRLHQSLHHGQGTALSLRLDCRLHGSRQLLRALPQI